jgi:hypothetical protein
MPTRMLIFVKKYAALAMSFLAVFLVVIVPTVVLTSGDDDSTEKETTGNQDDIAANNNSTTPECSPLFLSSWHKTRNTWRNTPTIPTPHNMQLVLCGSMTLIQGMTPCH